VAPKFPAVAPPLAGGSNTLARMAQRASSLPHSGTIGARSLLWASAPGYAHMAGERGPPVMAVDDEIMALGLAPDGLVDGAE